MPWSLRLACLLLLAGAGALVWSKRPWVGDVAKVCQVAELSACPGPGSSLVSDGCKIAWLERSMWSFDRLAQMPRGGGPGGGDFLRSLAREAGLAACPEADVVDQEFASRRQQEEVTRRAQAEPEAESVAGLPSVPALARGDTGEGTTERRVHGIVKSQAPSVEGEMDPALVSKEVRARVGAVKACYERALRRQPSLSGQVKLAWVITAAGTVSDVELREDSMGDAEVAACIKGLVRRWRFVAPSGGSVEVVYPFTFQPSSEVAP